MRVFHVAALLLFGLLFLAKQSTQLSPVYELKRKVNPNAEPFLGIVIGSPASEELILGSGIFFPLDAFFLHGRKFTIGKIGAANVVYVNAGGDTANVVLSTQLLLDIFVNIRAIIQFGNAGSVDPNLSVGDVVVPDSFTFSGYWEWKSNTSKRGKLKFGDFNLPNKGNNSLGSVDFQKVTVTTLSGSSQKYRWLPSDPAFLLLAAEKLADLKLEQCAGPNKTDGSNCVGTVPKVVFGLKGSSADIYYKNAAIGEFLNKRLNISTVDTGSAAVTLVGLTNGVPSITFSAISNTVGAPKSSDSVAPSVAGINAFKVAIAFVELLAVPFLVSQS